MLWYFNEFQDLKAGHEGVRNPHLNQLDTIYQVLSGLWKQAGRLMGPIAVRKAFLQTF